jgi:hypothetical protein
MFARPLPERLKIRSDLADLDRSVAASRLEDPAETFKDLGPKDACPMVNPATTPRGAGIRLSPVEGFVLSRVDGRTSYSQICSLTGLGFEATLDVLRKLKRERLIANPGESAPLLELHDDGSAVAAEELAPGPDLDDETKARIVRLHRKCKTLSPHQLLGLPADADAAAFKRAYFAASRELHPDRHFGRDIGPFRDRLAEIFAHLTQAFEQCKK